MLPVRFWNKVHKTADGCWLWTGRLRPDGYADLKYEGKMMLAHRLSWIDQHGPVPDGKELDHLCRQRHCVNPEHLEPVTRRENIMRGDLPKMHRDITHCPAGHEYTPQNTRVDRKGKRNCRTCSRGHTREWQERNGKFKHTLIPSDLCVAPYLRAARRDKGLTQRALGSMIGVGQRQISTWERGIARPRKETVARLALLLDVSYDDLVGPPLPAATARQEKQA
jgi:ribosome-binding protein aMBF1 (putative translation factor)